MMWYRSVPMQYNIQDFKIEDFKTVYWHNRTREQFLQNNIKSRKQCVYVYIVFAIYYAWEMWVLNLMIYAEHVYIHICIHRGSSGLNARWSWGWAVEFIFLAWSSIAQSVCQRAFSLVEIRFQRRSGFETCIQQRKTTCLPSIQKSLACVRASELTTTYM